MRASKAAAGLWGTVSYPNMEMKSKIIGKKEVGSWWSSRVGRTTEVKEITLIAQEQKNTLEYRP